MRSWLFIGLLVAVALVAFALSVYDHDRDEYRHQVALAGEQALQVAAAVAAEVSGDFRHTQRIFTRTAKILTAAAAARPEGGLAVWVGAVRERIAQMVEENGAIEGLEVLDRAGTVVAGFGAVSWAPTPAMPGRVVLRETLLGADGEPAGVMVAALNLSVVRDSLALGGSTSRWRALVIDPSGGILFQGPVDAASVSSLSSEVLRSLWASGRSGVERGEGDGAPLRAFVPVAEGPVLVVIEWETGEIEARWQQQAWCDGLSVAGLGLLLVLLAVLHAVQQRRAEGVLAERVQQRTDELAKVNRRLIDAERIAHLGHWERELLTGEGFWSDENFRIYGLPPAPTSPKLERFLACIHPDDRESFRRMREWVVMGLSSYQLRIRVVRPDGTVRHVSSQAEVIRDASGRKIRLIGTTLDITDLVEAEQRLRESEEKYRTMFEVARDAIFLVDRDSHAIIAANRATRRIYGYTTEEFLGLTTTDLSAEPEKTLEALRSGQSFVPLRRHRRKDGSEIYVELTSVRAKVGGRMVLVMAARDITDRVANEARLATAKIRLLEAERIAHLGHWEWLPPTGAHFWSRELYRILGVTPETTRPSWPALLDRIHCDDRARAAALPDGLGYDGDSTALEVRVVRPEGDIRHVQITLQITRDAQRQVSCMFGTALDVSDRHAAQAALSESYAALSAVINATEHDMVLLVNADGTVRIANDKVAQVYGRSVSEIVGRSMDTFMPSEVAAPRRALVDYVLESGRSVHLEEAEAGLVFDTHCAPALGPDGRPLGVAMFARNITNRKQIENSLRKLSRAIEQTPLSVVITDLDGFVEYVNPHFTKVSGYPADEVVGRNSRLLKSGYTRPPDYRAMWRTIAAGEVWTGEFHNRASDGRLFWESASIAPVRNEQGVVTHYVAIKEDITQRKRAEQELLAAKERAEAASVAKSQFLATVSHELRTPLNAIIGFSECMSTAAFGPLGDARYQRFADGIHEAGIHLLKLINDILDVAHAEAGTLQLNETIVDPRGEVLAAVEGMRATIDAAGLILAVDLPEHLPLLYADERALRAIIGNLLSNAVKFTTAGGQVRVSIRVEDSGLFALSVSDTGIGIPADRVGEVVRPFSQLDGEFNREHEGTGLGLSLCRSMAELHGGHLDIESTVGVGTTVTVRLPCDRVLSPGQNHAALALALGLTG